MAAIAYPTHISSCYVPPASVHSPLAAPLLLHGHTAQPHAIKTRIKAATTNPAGATVVGGTRHRALHGSRCRNGPRKRCVITVLIVMSSVRASAAIETRDRMSWMNIDQHTCWQSAGQGYRRVSTAFNASLARLLECETRYLMMPWYSSVLTGPGQAPSSLFRRRHEQVDH